MGKYVSKSHGIVMCRRSAKWHAQARMLSRALPVDVVIVIGDHVRELAAIVLQKFMRGAAVRRLAWGLPGLCDADGSMEIWCTCEPSPIRTTSFLESYMMTVSVNVTVGGVPILGAEK